MKVLSTLPNYRTYCKAAIELLEANGCELVTNELDRPMTFDDLKDIVSDIDGVVIGIDEWDEALLKFAPNLKVISRFGVGVDNINLEDAKKRNIVVTNSPGINTVSVAEHALMLILSVLRQLPMLNGAAKAGVWTRVLHHELRGMTVGLIGFGGISRHLAKRLVPFEVKIIAYDKFPNQAAADELGVTLVSLDEVIQNSDILSLHVPATPETINFINEKTIAKAKDGVYLINTSRGAVVDEAAVCAALKSGKIAGFGTDVFQHEPLSPGDPLTDAPHVVCTPHLAAESFENWATTGVITAQAMLDVFDGKDPKNRLV